LIVIDVDTSPSGMPENQRTHIVERIDRDAFATDLASERA